MDRALNYLALAQKAGKAALGEEPVASAARALHAHLILVASDASDHTWRRARSLTAGTQQQCLRARFTKAEMGFVVGRTSLAIAAIEDVGLALSLVEALGEPEKYAAAADALRQRKDKQLQRKAEAKAHARNKRFGKRWIAEDKKEK